MTRSRSREFFLAVLILYKKIPWVPSTKEPKGQRIKPVAGQQGDDGPQRSRRSSPQTDQRPPRARHENRRPSQRRRKFHAT